MESFPVDLAKGGSHTKFHRRNYICIRIRIRTKETTTSHCNPYTTPQNPDRVRYRENAKRSHAWCNACVSVVRTKREKKMRSYASSCSAAAALVMILPLLLMMLLSRITIHSTRFTLSILFRAPPTKGSNNSGGKSKEFLERAQPNYLAVDQWPVYSYFKFLSFERVVRIFRKPYLWWNEGNHE